MQNYNIKYYPISFVISKNIYMYVCVYLINNIY